MRIVVNQADEVLLPSLQYKRLADKLALGDETDLLNERDDVGGGDLVTARFLFALGHDPGSPTAAILEPALPLSQLPETAAVSEV